MSGALNDSDQEPLNMKSSDGLHSKLPPRVVLSTFAALSSYLSLRAESITANSVVIGNLNSPPIAYLSLLPPPSVYPEPHNRPATFAADGITV